MASEEQPASVAEPTATTGGALVGRIARFIADSTSERFDELALAAFTYQIDRLPAYRALAADRGRLPAAIARWSDVPTLPVLAMKSLALHTDPPVEVFRSSGTTAGTIRSTHYQPFPELYRAAIDASFPVALLDAGELHGRPPMLSLIPQRSVLPDSSLAFMLEHVLERFADPERSLVGAGSRGVELARVRSWLGARQREGRPVVVLATSLALAQLLDGLARIELKFRLPPGSRLFETGGAKGQEHQLDPAAQASATTDRLGIGPARTVREYGMTELSSQLYTGNLQGGAPDIFVPPHWVRVRPLDPETLAETTLGRPGLLAIFDLANLGSAVHLLTEDLGVAVPLAGGGTGIRLVGRASGAELRGCSLTAEELARATVTT